MRTACKACVYAMCLRILSSMAASVDSIITFINTSLKSNKRSLVLQSAAAASDVLFHRFTVCCERKEREREKETE